MVEQGFQALTALGAGWVLWLLIALSVMVVAVSLERAFALSRDGSPTAPLAVAVNAFLAEGDAEAFAEQLGALGGTEARILSTGVEVRHLGVGAAEKAMNGAATAEKLAMESRLAFLATVGSNAPFIGLLGTVLGIIQAMRDLSSSDASDAVIAGIAEALVATAVGLMVAIPAVVLYNVLSRWVKRRLSRAESLADQVLARLTGAPKTTIASMPQSASEAVAHGS